MRIKRLVTVLVSVFLVIASVGLNPAVTQAATQTFGNTTVGSFTDNGDVNYLNGSQFTTGTSGGTLTSISAYVAAIGASPNNKYQVAIYADSNNKATTLLGKSATGTLVANSWNTLPVTAPLSANTKYWLMYNTNGTVNKNNMKYGIGGTGGSSTNSVAFGTMPTSFGAFSGNPWKFSIYGTYTVANPATPPTVSLTAPVNNATVSGASLTVSANASDAASVVGVQFKLDGANLGAEDTSAPYSVAWNTTASANGAHSLTAVARNNAGLSATSSTVTVTVANPLSAPTGLTGTSPTSSQVALGWTASGGSSGYKVYRNGTQVGTAATPSYLDNGLSAATTYSYTVSATGGSVESPQSSAIAVTTLANVPLNALLTEDFNYPDGTLGNGWSGISAPEVYLPAIISGKASSNHMNGSFLATKPLNINGAGDWEIEFDATASLRIGGGGVEAGFFNPANNTGYFVFIGNAVHIYRANPDGTLDYMTNYGRPNEGAPGLQTNHIRFTHDAAGNMNVYLDGERWASVTDNQVTPGNTFFMNLYNLGYPNTFGEPNYDTSMDNLVVRNYISQ